MTKELTSVLLSSTSVLQEQLKVGIVWGNNLIACFAKYWLILKREIIWNDWKFVLLIPRRNLMRTRTVYMQQIVLIDTQYIVVQIPLNVQE